MQWGCTIRQAESKSKGIQTTRESKVKLSLEGGMGVAMGQMGSDENGGWMGLTVGRVG